MFGWMHRDLEESWREDLWEGTLGKTYVIGPLWMGTVSEDTFSLWIPIQRHTLWRRLKIIRQTDSLYGCQYPPPQPPQCLLNGPMNRGHGSRDKIWIATIRTFFYQSGHWQCYCWGPHLPVTQANTEFSIWHPSSWGACHLEAGWLHWTFAMRKQVEIRCRWNKNIFWYGLVFNALDASPSTTIFGLTE